MSGEVSQMSSSSSGSEEPDDEFMLRLYTGKLTSTEQYEVIQEENETNEDDQSDDRNKHDASSLEFSEKTKKRPLEDPSWWEDDTPSAKKAKLYHSAPSTPMRYWEQLKCNNCQQQGHMASHCPNQKKRRCHLCGEPEHERECPNQVCFRCHGLGHKSWECAKTHLSPQQCYRCSGHHDPWRCPTFKVKGSKKNLFCFNCGRSGHSGQECDLPNIDQLAQLNYRDPRKLMYVLRNPKDKYEGRYSRESESRPCRDFNGSRKRRYSDSATRKNFH